MKTLEESIDSLGQAVKRAGDELDRRKAVIADLRAALEEVRELIEGYVDVQDGDYGTPRPNQAMRAVFVIDQALEKGK